MRRKISLLLLLFMFATLLIGCSSTSSSNNGTTTQTSTNVSSTNSTNTTMTTQTTQVTPVFVDGDRAKPIPMGVPFVVSTSDYTYGDYKVEITVNNITRGQDAEDIVLNENPFNEPSGDNQEYLITNITVKLIEIDQTNQTYANDGFSNWMFFEVATASGKLYNPFIVAVIPDDIDNCSLFVGNTCSGNIVKLVDNNEDLMLKYMTSWFKLFDHEYTLPTPSNDNPNPNFGTQSNPVPLGETQVVVFKNYTYDYKAKITVNTITRGQAAEDIVLENMFNDASGDTQEYIIVNVTVEIIYADETDDYYKEYGIDILDRFDFVSKVSGVYNDFIYATIPNDLSNYSLFLGGSATANIVYLINNDDDVLIKYGTTWFNLE